MQTMKKAQVPAPNAQSHDDPADARTRIHCRRCEAGGTVAEFSHVGQLRCPDCHEARYLAVEVRS